MLKNSIKIKNNIFNIKLYIYKCWLREKLFKKTLVQLIF